MPSRGNGSINIDVKARVMGYEDSINKMKKLLENVGENSSLGKSLSAEIATAEKKLASLKKNFNLEASTGGQIHNIVKEVNSIGDALMNVAEKAQNLTGRDLKFDSLGDEVKELVNDLAAANRDLEGSVAGGMKSFIESSQDLKKTLSEILNIDVSKLDSEEIFKRMGKAAKDASADVQKAEKAYKNAQQNEKNARETSDKQVARQSSNQAILDDIREQEKIYTNAANEYKEKITKAVQKVFSEEKAVEGQNILDSFFKDINPENEKEKIEKAVNDINKLLGEKKFNITSFKNTFLGVKRGRSVFTNQDLKEMADAEAKIREDINNSAELKSQTKRSALNLLDEHKIEESVKKTVTGLEKASDTVTDAVKNAQNKVAEAAEKTESAKTSYNEAITQASTIDQAQGALDSQYQQLLQQNEQLTHRVQELEERLNAALSQAAGEVKTSFAKEGERQPGFQISTEEAQRYEQQLERVKSAEQALGKLKGLITQWFSIYSVVRMASSAIREIISTISSLDKVITEIAIVTNMTQSELWGQMDSYAQMAQTYAASIEGVYQVSQLYYQQGLQTADVMALTEQTLKMARISGLDYAAATNYKFKSYVA